MWRSWIKVGSSRETCLVKWKYGVGRKTEKTMAAGGGNKFGMGGNQELDTHGRKE